jgi:hypothetical protein
MKPTTEEVLLGLLLCTEPKKFKEQQGMIFKEGRTAYKTEFLTVNKTIPCGIL